MTKTVVIGFATPYIDINPSSPTYKDLVSRGWYVADGRSYPWTIIGNNYYISKDLALTFAKGLCGYDTIYDYSLPDPTYIYTFPISQSSQPVGTCPSGGTKGTNVIYIIQTQNNLVGTVEVVADILIWHLTSPVAKDIAYGISTDIPATWIDSDRSEQMAVIRGTDVFLDKRLTGGIGEVNLKLTDIKIISQKSGYTTQISYSPPPISGPPPILATWTIQGEKGMTGTVELISGIGLLWHITSPVKLDIYYGGSIATPATYVDSNGIDQMAVYQKGGWGNGTQDFALDQNYTGGVAEKYATSAEVDIVSSVPNKTMLIRYPSTAGGIGGSTGNKGASPYGMLTAIAFATIIIAVVSRKKKG